MLICAPSTIRYGMDDDTGRIGIVGAALAPRCFPRAPRDRGASAAPTAGFSVLLRLMPYGTAIAMKGSERTGRLSAEDWAQAALELIAEQGVAAVAVEPLARRLGVTKGSFYWHFPSREALLVAALERWEQVEQEEVFGQLEAIPDPGQRLRSLFTLVAHEARSHI